MLLLIAQATAPSTAPTLHAGGGDVFSPAFATIVAALAAGAVSLTAVVLNLKHQAIATKYKTYLEAYKIAKDADLVYESDREWARKIVRTIERDVSSWRSFTERMTNGGFFFLAIAYALMIPLYLMALVAPEFKPFASADNFLIACVSFFVACMLVTWVPSLLFALLERRSKQKK